VAADPRPDWFMAGSNPARHTIKVLNKISTMNNEEPNPADYHHCENDVEYHEDYGKWRVEQNKKKAMSNENKNTPVEKLLDIEAIMEIVYQKMRCVDYSFHGDYSPMDAVREALEEYTPDQSLRTIAALGDDEFEEFIIDARNGFVQRILNHFPHEQPAPDYLKEIRRDVRVASEDILITYDELCKELKQRRKSIREAQQKITELLEDNQRLREALGELVTLKGHKEAFGKDDYYEKSKEEAWNKAAAALASTHQAEVDQEAAWNSVYSDLDEMARDVDSYEFGLPYSVKDGLIAKLSKKYTIIPKH
jgi:hypothetical protein